MSLVPDRMWSSQPRQSAPKVEESSQPWTTARCHRLLRPLVSRIASLRREVSVCRQVTPSSAISAPSSRTGGRYEEEPGAESEWLMPRKKRPRLTYSQRRGPQPAPPQQQGGLDQTQLGQQGNQDGNTSSASGSKACVKRPFRSVQPERQPKATVPGEIAASTPLLKRARGMLASSPVARARETDPASNQPDLDRARRTKTGPGAQKRLDERLFRLRERLAHNYANFEAIYRSVEALLRATRPGDIHGIGVARGPRSLMEMCLRRVPQYIVELESWEKLEAEQSGTISTLDEVDTSAQIYNELEAFGTNVGWRHLRVVVRADGMNAVKQGIKESLFGDEFSLLIVDLCVLLGAVDEAEDLIAALVDRQYPQPASTDSDFTQSPALQPLVRLNSFAHQNQRTPSLFRQYTSLLSSGRLPIEWLATSGFERIWSSATRALASTDHSSDATTFITQSISLLYGRKRTRSSNAALGCLDEDIEKANQRTLMSSLSILASMRLLGENELGQPSLSASDTRRVTIIGDRLKYVMKACLAALEGCKRGRANQSLDVLYLTLFLSSGQSQGEELGNYVRRGIAKLSSPLETFITTKERRTRKSHDNIAWLISSIARAYSRGASVAPQQCLDELFKRLESLKFGPHELDNLKAAAAFLIAQQTSNVRDLIYAESLHLQDRSNSGAPAQHHSGNTLFTGYRWEETIGEWVTVSPVRNKQRVSTTKKHLRLSTLGSDTEGFLTRSTSETNLVSERMSDTETSPDESGKDHECSTGERTCCGCTEQGMMLKKRPNRAQDIEKPAANFVAEAPVLQQKLVIAASSVLRKSQLRPGKENQVGLLAKKPRRSSGRIVLGTHSQLYNSAGRRNKYQDSIYSDDELCN
ncbi:hypothetical protein GGS21DRAFT_202611 [Xylaria nigripes]|nr:hypothetical protein GGS21DRAFT_202611 [Xylaria nigripes]